MKKAIFITVRTGSTRLKNKPILKIKGSYTIEYVINACKKSKHADTIILCTTNNPSDDILCDIAKKNNIDYFRGSEENKWQRWKEACQKYKIDFFVTADGDDLFYSHLLSDSCFSQYMQNKTKDLVIDGQGLYNDVYGFTKDSIIAISKIKNSYTLEPHIAIPFLKEKYFNVQRIKNYPEILEKKNVRMTLDYKEDLKFFTKVIEKLGNNDYNIYDIYKIIDKFPHLAKINFFLEAEWKSNQKKDSYGTKK